MLSEVLSVTCNLVILSMILTVLTLEAPAAGRKFIVDPDKTAWCLSGVLNIILLCWTWRGGGKNIFPTSLLFMHHFYLHASEKQVRKWRKTNNLENTLEFWLLAKRYSPRLILDGHILFQGPGVRQEIAAAMAELCRKLLAIITQFLMHHYTSQ